MSIAERNFCQRVRALLAGLSFLVPLAHAIESDPLPMPKDTVRAQAVRLYNEGVVVLLARDYALAQRRFEAALELDEAIAEAHNNLAFSLRMQSAKNFERSLRHYNRAIELKPTLTQAYMYRGVLFTQMGDVTRARADHARLMSLDSAMATKLESAILGVERDERHGIAGQYE